MIVFRAALAIAIIGGIAFACVHTGLELRGATAAGAGVSGLAVGAVLGWTYGHLTLRRIQSGRQGRWLDVAGILLGTAVITALLDHGRAAQLAGGSLALGILFGAMPYIVSWERNNR